MNTVKALQQKPFLGLNPEKKAELKKLGPDRPELTMEQAGKDRGKDYTRKFSATWYERKTWLTGCATRNALFCFPCLLYGGEVPWTKTGVRDLKHLSDKVKKHEQCETHLDNSLRLAMFGRVNIATQLNEEYQLSIKQHNEEVSKNRYILSKLIDCIRFCGAFELALRGHDETEDSKNPGVFRGLVDFVGSIDSAMQTHLETATVFKGTSETIQIELLDSMFAVTQAFIIQELRSAQYVSIQANDTTDVSTMTQSVLVFRYIDGRNKVVERFFCFKYLKDSSAETISTAVLEELNVVFPEPSNKEKLIAQSFDGANVMSGASGGVQKRIRDVFPNAHYVHCYAHQLNVIMEQAVSQISQVRIFFGDLTGFPAFFSHSPKRMEVYQQIVGQRHPKGSQSSWNFHSCTIGTLYAHREELLQCFETIANSRFDLTTVGEASWFIRTLWDRRFLYFLFLFHDLMPYVDNLSNQLQKRAIDAAYIKNAIADFVCEISKVSESTDHLDSRLPAQSVFADTRLKIETLNQAAKEVCDIIILHATELFGFTGHLQSATLLDSNLFKWHEHSFPVQALNKAIEAYPMLNKEKLLTELTIIYRRPEFQCANGALSLYGLFIDNNLEDLFSETVNLLKILVTTPMTTVESERCFSTLKRIKTFLRSTMTEDRLNALAMLSMEKELIKEIPDFNKRTIEKFSTVKERHAKFMYK